MTTTTTSRTSPSQARPALARVFVAVATMVAGIMIGLVSLFATPASASPLHRVQTAVALRGQAAGQRVGTHERILAGQSRARAPGYDQSVVGFGVGAEADTAAGSSAIDLSPEDTWGNPNTLARHFRDHGADFGSTSAEDYARRASQFFQRSQLERLPTKIDSDGVLRAYDPETNTFGSYNANGTTKTFFTPRRGIGYWNDQPGSPPWTGS